MFKALPILLTGALLTNTPTVSWTVYSTPVMERGIDVSSYQGMIEWDKVVEDDVNFAFIRCKSAVTGEDIMFDINMEQTELYGIPRGIYYYSGALTSEQIIEETNYILSKAFKYNPELPIVLDIEGDLVYMPDDQLHTNVNYFCTAVECAGFTPMVYGSSGIMKRLEDVECKKWLAYYRDEPIMNPDYWQKSSKGEIAGINGYVDIDYKMR